MHNMDLNAPLTCPIDSCSRNFKSVPGLEYHLQKHADGKILDAEGRPLLCTNLKAAKRRAMTVRKTASLKADVAREMARNGGQAG